MGSGRSWPSLQVDFDGDACPGASSIFVMADVRHVRSEGSVACAYAPKECILQALDVQASE